MQRGKVVLEEAHEGSAKFSGLTRLHGRRSCRCGYITVEDQCRASADGLWAVGDCNGRDAFTHTSWNDHAIVVANLFDNASA